MSSETALAAEPGDPTRIEIVRDLAARAVIVALFTFLTFNLLGDFLKTGRLTGLMLLASEALVVVLTVFRRHARLIDRSLATGVITATALAGPPLLRAANLHAVVPDGATAVASAFGLGLVIAAMLTLGRSFGIAPANRGVVAAGPYNVIRHPVYAGHLITHIAFVIANPRPLNVAIVLVSDTALIVRALVEERVLGSDAAYEAYCHRVAWHLVPGVF